VPTNIEWGLLLSFFFPLQFLSNKRIAFFIKQWGTKKGEAERIYNMYDVNEEVVNEG
jgi:hypothetical protein